MQYMLLIILNAKHHVTFCCGIVGIMKLHWYWY